MRLLWRDGRPALGEGHWSTGSGLTSAECEELVRAVREEATVIQLRDPALWGREISDERYLLVSLG